MTVTTMRIFSILALGLLLATVGRVAADPVKAANDAASAKAAECFKLAAGSAAQTQCLSEALALSSRASALAAAEAAKPRPQAAPAASAPQAAGDRAPSSGKSAGAPQAAAAKTAAPARRAGPITEQEIAAGRIGPSQGLVGIDLKGMDLETAMMAVQTNRANLLEEQLKSQIANVQKKNDEIAKLNDLLGKLNALAASAPANQPEKWINLGSNQAEGRSVHAALKAAGVTMPTGTDEVNEPGTNIFDAKKKTIDLWIQQIKSQIDEKSNSQQMDMLRLQSLSNKRNEAFETMTNFIKKMQENRSSIIGNMR